MIWIFSKNSDHFKHVTFKIHLFDAVYLELRLH